MQPWGARMGYFRTTLMLCTSIPILQGCSISPMSANFGEYFQSDRIANRNSCEFRDELIDLTADKIEYDGNDDLARRIRKNPKELFKNVKLLGPDVKELVGRFYTTTVAYSYTFTTKEINNLSGSAGISFPYVPIDIIKFSAGNDRDRQTVEQFTTTDTWYSLFEDDTVVHRCKGFVPDSKNFMYPLTGKIGLREVIKSFFDLVQVGSLAGDESQLATKSVSFEFMTRLVGKVEPSVLLARVGGSPQLVSASGIADVQREDKHAVNITIAIPKKGAFVSQSDAAAAAIYENRRLENLQALGAFGRR